MNMAPYASRTLKLKKGIKAKNRYVPIESAYFDATRYFYDQEQEMIVGKCSVSGSVNYVGQSQN